MYFVPALPSGMKGGRCGEGVLPVPHHGTPRTGVCLRAGGVWMDLSSTTGLRSIGSISLQQPHVARACSELAMLAISRCRCAAAALPHAWLATLRDVHFVAGCLCRDWLCVARTAQLVLLHQEKSEMMTVLRRALIISGRVRGLLQRNCVGCSRLPDTAWQPGHRSRIIVSYI